MQSALLGLYVCEVLTVRLPGHRQHESLIGAVRTASELLALASIGRSSG